MHTHPDLGAADLVEVADHVYAYIQPDGSWYINNTGFVVGSSVVVVDACSTERRTREFRSAIESVSSAPVRALINTHHHGDHTYGNAIIGAATIVGQENCRAAVIASGPAGDTGIWDPVDWGDVPLTPPDLTFRDSLRLWSDDRPIEVSYVGRPAHTDNDSLVWLPEQKALFCGDLLFSGGTPFLLMGSVSGALAVLTEVLSTFPAEVIVPGHGAPGGKELIAPVAEYLRFVLCTAEQGIAAGLTPLELAREVDLGEFADLLDSERIVGNLHRAYHDLGAVEGELDLIGVLREMVAFNGGPLSCYA